MQTEQAFYKSKNKELGNGIREMRRTRVEMRGWDGCAGAEDSARKCGNLGGNAKNVGNQGGDAGNQGGNLSIVVEMT